MRGVIAAALAVATVGTGAVGCAKHVGTVAAVTRSFNRWNVLARGFAVPET